MKAISFSILSSPSLFTEITTIKIEKNIISQKVIGKSSKNITDLLLIPIKLSSKK